jgi:hypothetical protein
MSTSLFLRPGAAVEKIVEKFGRMWKKMENYDYFCTQ